MHQLIYALQKPVMYLAKYAGIFLSLTLLPFLPLMVWVGVDYFTGSLAPTVPAMDEAGNRYMLFTSYADTYQNLFLPAIVLVGAASASWYFFYSLKGNHRTAAFFAIPLLVTVLYQYIYVPFLMG